MNHNTFDAPMMSANGANVFMTEDGIHVHHPTLSREEVQENVAKILNWVNGPGQKLLISQTRLPFSLEEADEIRKAHEQFEFKCMQALAMYAQLREPKDLDFTTSDSLDRMEQVVKGFMQSLQKRRNVVVACYSFFRLVSELRELSQSPDQLAEMLEAANDVESVDRCLSRLNNTLRSLDTKSGLLSREGERVRVLVEQLPVIQAVERAVDESRRRVATTSEHLKLRVLETKKRRQVLTCERDAQQANSWLTEMCDRLVASYRSDCVGMTPVESAARLDAHKKLESKAAETHEYCKQLSKALGLMYRAAGSPTDRAEVFTADTASLWRRLTRLLQETRERLEVADAFYRSVDILLSRVEQLLILISRDLDSGVALKQVRTKYGRHRDELLGEFEDTKNVGVALIERIQLPMDEQNPMEGAECIERTNNVIKMKLYTLWLKIREFLMLLGQKIEITAWIERWAVIKIQIERLYELMLRLEEHWDMRERWPRTVADAEEAVAEHRRSAADVNRLFDQVLRDLGPLLSRPEGEKGSAEDEAVRVAALDAVDQLRARKGDWDGRWNTHKDHLDRRLELLILMSDIEKEVDLRLELLEQCKKRPLGEEQPVRECEGQVGRWLEDLPDLRRRINEFLGDLKQEVGDEFEEDEARLRGKWSNYEHQVDLFRWIVEAALEILHYYASANSQLRSFSAKLPQVQSLSEIEGMLQDLATLIAEGRQLVSPVELKEASRDLYGSEDPVLPLLDRLDSVTVAITALMDEANAMKSAADEDAIQMSTVHAVHASRPMLTMQAQQPAAGGDFDLEVSFSGLGQKPEAAWFKDGRPWSVRPPWRETWEESAVRLRQPAIRPEDAGLYTCALEGRGGARAEGSFEVQVREPPRFLRHLEENPTFVEGDPVLLQCQVSGTPEPSCQWFRDGHPVRSNRGDLLIDNGDGVCAIKIPHILPRHAGLYECRISNPVGESVERCYVNVQDEYPGADDSESVASRVTLESGPDEPTCVPPTLKDELLPAQECSENEPLVLDVTYDGSPSPEVTWYKDGRVVMDRPRSKIKTGPNRSTLTINPATSADGGTYAAVVKNQMGSQRSTSQVTVRPAGFAPTLIRQSSQPQSAREGEPVTFEFIMSAEPPCDIRWIKGNREIRPSPDFAVDSPEPGVHRLRIAKAYLEDSGKYCACATNPLGTKEVPFELLVDREEIDEDRIAARSAGSQRQGPPPKSYSDESPTPCPPRLTDELDETQICSPGDRVFLRCRLTGHPPPQVTWAKDGNKITSSDSHQPKKHPHIQISNFDDEHRLVIPDAKPSDTGVYTLTAFNSLGSTTTECDLQICGNDADQMRTTLIFHNTVVKSPPEFTQLFRDEICKVGDTVVLECQIVGLPPPTVWWSFNGEMMDETRCQFKNQGEKYSLVIPNVWLEDSGRYSVTAENSSGVATCSSLVIVEEHGRTGLVDRTNFSRSSSRPLSPVLAMPLPAHSQLSQLAPAASVERARTVEVTPKQGGKYDFDNPPKLIVDRFENSGAVPPAGVITASQATRQHAAAPGRPSSSSAAGGKPKVAAKPRVQIIRDTDATDAPAASTSSAGRRPFGKTGSGVRIVREYDNSKSASFPRNPNASVKVTMAAPPADDGTQRFSMVESSEYDSD